MGRKRWWRGGLGELLVLCILHHVVVLADGNVGCLFSENVCNVETERCFNDRAFGKCIPRYVNLENGNLYQYTLDASELEVLRLQLERLESAGYKWKHPFTQCIMQTSLRNVRRGPNGMYDLRLCERLKIPRLDERNQVSIPAVAILRISADKEKALPKSNLADTLYHQDIKDKFPSGLHLPQALPYNRESIDRVYRQRYANWRDVKNDRASINDERYEGEHGRSLSNTGQQLYLPRTRRYSFIDDYRNDDVESYEDTSRNKKLPENNNKNLYDDKLEFLPNENSSSYTLLKSTSSDDADEKDERTLARRYKHRQSLLDFINDYTTTDNTKKSALDASSDNADEEDERTLARRYKYRQSLLDFINDYDTSPDDADEEDERTLARRYKHRQSLFDFINDYTTTDNTKDMVIGRDHKDDLDYDGEAIDDGDSVKIEKSDVSTKADRMYTEGGVVQPSKSALDRSGETSETYDDVLDELLWRRELAGFKRRERLDVKKPGPLFATNNYAFKTQPTPNYYMEDIQDDEKYELSMKKSLPVNNKENDDSLKNYENVDLDHVYIEFKQEFRKWAEGEHVVDKVEKLLELPAGTLTDVRVGRAEVTFKVVGNDKNYNSTDIIHKIGEIRDQLQKEMGVKVLKAGIGDKTKLPPILEITWEDGMSSSLFRALVACGVAAAIGCAVVTLIIARRTAKYRAKLVGLTTPDPEASKDYQDLCRARMQAKQPNEKVESPRITSLSREQEPNNASSNRSSTSSWSEEPTISNMDISTGHMVLSYMEDHLKNKDRLDQEWAAICACRADPSFTEVAMNDENIELNRPRSVIPYDHSRVVLNDLANAHNSDYINASTITDHDPRNPAYIATQGPLPLTTADFWQMIWEQGSVVIVMLTRLTEEGRSMCHRYWPEEGSELYHIYEVHLVSEHFWCDDYLVRSFYLKNLRTSETRTVTQFHFLSWPENGVPYSTKALLEFRRKVNKSYRGRSCPIVVHCNDGAGRTGTYCLIDMVLNRMAKGAKEIDIAATLEHIRDQRPGMVATKQQFEFVLMAVAEEVHAILKALPVPAADKNAAASDSSPPSKSEQ
ncbi:receptor-type tyrosine-protein phosphatase N2 isoform X2 [Pseudomyrmex gracilis]|uniref:receptor-type tyrosine-protein phosphatase N2 isoform X2 n=1 Tax=Pseudomyrmex gracilis TaxID=219809 RepID=UPI000994A2E1|nr:receptor-type tyrosine-protein phosphatase N2 isoform X2 [Pseudomyrmex gracilis]